ncbi:neuronal acetylcholine receptor subunit alpha-7-like [Pomacea canaliculata]|uniref:neuronal acetylcholine receptor subunit alpha-7-like n=1 Tax=Pomacea canaliculata TaxID=400727 RepID=UPI000D73A883|nr:neuronal acetylcholine receptor subunit alpha-7-like [Pomacea canaliculata]
MKNSSGNKHPVKSLVVWISVSGSQSAEDVSRIHAELENSIISPYIRPAKNFSRPLIVNISFHLVAIVDFNAASHRLTSSALLTVTWQDDYLTWEPAAYGGITRILPDPTKLWRPRLTIRNTLTDMKVIGQNYMVARHDGTVKWFPAEMFETFCHGDVKYFPYDHHTCDLQMFIWAEGEGPIELQPVKSEIDFDSYVGNGEWKVSSTAVRRVTYHLHDDPISVVVYEVTLRRRPALVVMTIVLPVFILAGLNIFVFLIPYESGERLSFAVTILLSYGVFMASVVSLLPGSVKTMSILIIDMGILLICPPSTPSSAPSSCDSLLAMTVARSPRLSRPWPGAWSVCCVWKPRTLERSGSLHHVRYKQRFTRSIR